MRPARRSRTPGREDRRAGRAGTLGQPRAPASGHHAQVRAVRAARHGWARPPVAAGVTTTDLPMTAVPLSVLDLSPVSSGSTSRRALQDSVALARLAEELGFRRYWVAEHHGMPGVASSAPAVLIGAAAAATRHSGWAPEG